jgi:hypothetical protein
LKKYRLHKSQTFFEDGQRMWRGEERNSCRALFEKSKKLSDKLGVDRRIILYRTLKKSDECGQD